MHWGTLVSICDGDFETETTSNKIVKIFLYLADSMRFPIQLL